ATGGAGSPYTFTLVSGSLPNGLTLATNGALAGTPIVVGMLRFTVQATDNANFTVQAPLPPNRPGDGGGARSGPGSRRFKAGKHPDNARGYGQDRGLRHGPAGCGNPFGRRDRDMESDPV